MLHHPRTASLRQAGEDPLAFLDDLAATGDDLVPCAVGRRPAFLLNHPALIEHVLVRHPAMFVKGRGYMRASRLVGRGLLTASGRLHTARRRLLQPAFHRASVAAHAEAMVLRAAGLRDRWTAGTRVEVASEMQALTLDIASATLFGADLAPCAADVRRAVAAAMPPVDGLLAVIAPPYRVRQARRQLEALLDPLIAQRLRSERMQDDLLGLLLAAGPDVDLQQVRDDAVTVLLAGHDTIAHALTWTWLLLAAHPEVEQQMHAELKEVLQHRPPGAADLPALGYTRAVLAESLRLRPPAWVIVRESVAAHALAGTLIPAGALVIVSPWVTHRDARFFPDPQVFDPARWTTPETAARPKLAYLPFGAGSRSCIGEHFAWMEGTLVLATIAQRWRLSSAEPARVGLSPRITLRPAGPVMMTPEDMAPDRAPRAT